MIRKKRSQPKAKARKAAKPSKKITPKSRPKRVSAKRTASAPAKPKTDFVSQNIPQSESLLSEMEYGESLAPYFDVVYSEKVIRKIQAPFYKMLIDKYGIESACDLSCRTGQTLKLLNTLGIKRLAGADVSPAMLAESEKKLPKDTLFFQSDLFIAPQTIGDHKFDLILCTKDSLPLVLDDEALLNFFTTVKSMLSDKGIFLIEVWNYEKIWRRKERFMPIMERHDDRNELLFFLENDFHEELLVRNMIRLQKTNDEWFLRPLSIPARPITRNEIEFFATEAQFSKWGFLGNYAGSPYNSAESPYCISIIKK